MPVAELFEYKNIPERDDILLNGEDTTCTHRVTDGDEVKPVPQIKAAAKTTEKGTGICRSGRSCKRGAERSRGTGRGSVIGSAETIAFLGCRSAIYDPKSCNTGRTCECAKCGFTEKEARAGCGRSTRCADKADEDQSRDQWHTDAFAGEGKAGICRSV